MAWYTQQMIKSVRDKRVLEVLAGRVPKRFPPELARAAERRLKYLQGAMTLEEMRSPPSNRLEALSGDRSGFHSIRINRQWRICFHWTDAGAEDIEIVDYH